jgi:hypothetical protein
MIRNLKALGLCLVAVFAISAMAASAASANPNPITLTPGSYPAALTLDTITPQIYTTSAGAQITCTTVDGHGTITSPGVGDTNVTITDINYTGCTAKVGANTLPATVNMTGCDYLFHGGVEDVAGHFKEGTVDLVCPAGVTGPDVNIYSSAANHTAGTTLCVLTVWNFTNGKEITYQNNAGSPNDVTVKANEVETPVTRDGSILCGSPASAKYKGEVRVTAYEDLGTNASGTPIEGNRIGLTVSE